MLENHLSKEVTYKHLRLLTPTIAERVGIEAEAPFFISPYVDKESDCESCGVTYGPVQYSPNYITESPHIHPTEGGLYYFRVDREWFENSNHFERFELSLDTIGKDSNSSPWIALLTPQGEIYNHGNLERS